jgi:ankyrin repeat protein
MHYKAMLYCVVTLRCFGIHAMEQSTSENKLHLTVFSSSEDHRYPIVIPEELVIPILKNLIALDYVQTKKISLISMRCRSFVKEYNAIGEQIVTLSKKMNGLEEIKMICASRQYADVNYVSGVPSKYGKLRHYMSALMCASYFGNVELAQWLVDNGADVEKRSRCTQSKYKPYIYPPLFFSLHNLASFQNINPKIECLMALCRAGTDVNQVYGLHGNTILHNAAVASCSSAELESTITFLINRKANVNQQNLLKETPLHKFFGCRHSYLKNENILTILMRDGKADPTIKNCQGVSSYQLAQRLSNSFGGPAYLAIMREYDTVKMK